MYLDLRIQLRNKVPSMRETRCPDFAFQHWVEGGGVGNRNPAPFEMVLYFAMTGRRDMYRVLWIIKCYKVSFVLLSRRALLSTTCLMCRQSAFISTKQTSNLRGRATRVLPAFLSPHPGTCQNMQSRFCVCLCTYRRLAQMVQTYIYPYRPLYRPLGKIVQTYRP